MADQLPLDVWIDILTRLPVKNILQCTIVRKSWYALITSPNFISTHLNRSIVKKESRILIRESVEQDGEGQSGKENYYVHADNETFDEYDKFSFPYGGHLRIIGTCNGLVCLSDDRFGSVRSMYLWNPSIRKLITLPSSNISYRSHGSYTNSFGFGFDNATNDYKIVRIVHLEKDNTISYPPEVELYELRVGTWRRISPGDFQYVVLQCSPQAFLNDVVHWFGYDPNKSGKLLIVSFDLRNEGLAVMVVPVVVEHEMDWEMRIEVYRDWLSLIHKPRNDDYCNVWVMEEYGIEESWTKRFTINLDSVQLWRPYFFRENGEILLVKSDGYLHQWFGTGGDLLCYDPKRKQIKKVEGKTCILRGYLHGEPNLLEASKFLVVHLLPRQHRFCLKKRMNQREENEGRMLE